jgi:hypothetical protein
MTPTPSNKDRSTSDSNKSSPNPGTATKPNTRRNGPPALLEEHQDVKDSQEGRKFLEKHFLLCPPSEPPTHLSLSTCLHQISAMAGIPKQAINAIRSVAFLLDEMENTQIHEFLRTALDAQMTEFTSDMKLLVEDAKEKISDSIKVAEKRINMVPAPTLTQTQPRNVTNTYASMLINPPAHANPRIAAKEGIKARQFMMEGIGNSKFSHLDNTQLKAVINDILAGLDTGRIRSATKSRSGGALIEADTDETANWLACAENQRKLCDKIGANVEFRYRSYNIIAFNVSTAINPGDDEHRQEICEANNLEPSTITSARWAKAVERRTPNQRTAHLLLTFNNATAANRAITNGLSICNRSCHVERTKREPLRCLKCQGWNHLARDCTEDKDTCGNCAGPHRTVSCLTSDKRCVSCKTDDHASWSRKCPTFIRRTDEYNNRNPDNLLQYFPTADSCTWSTSFRSLPPPTTPKPQSSNIQQGKKTQHPKKIYDTYIPIGIGTGNPGVFPGYPYPYPSLPVPAHWGTGFCGYVSRVLAVTFFYFQMRKSSTNLFNCRISLSVFICFP